MRHWRILHGCAHHPGIWIALLSIGVGAHALAIIGVVAALVDLMDQNIT